MSRGDAISSQLAADRLCQIDLGLAGDGPLLRMELCEHFRPHFEATAPDARSNGDDKILRPAAELVVHSLNGLGCDVLENSPPACMDGCHRTISRVRNEDGKA